MQFKGRNLFKPLWAPIVFQGCPTWSKRRKTVKVIGAFLNWTEAELDYLFAIFASNKEVKFRLEVTEKDLSAWLSSVERRSKGAVEKYHRRCRAAIRRHNRTFLHPYGDPPTPQLLTLYQSAAKSEKSKFFSGGEFSWRKWPLNNVVYFGE